MMKGPYMDSCPWAWPGYYTEVSVLELAQMVLWAFVAADKLVGC